MHKNMLNSLPVCKVSLKKLVGIHTGLSSVVPIHVISH